MQMRLLLISAAILFALSPGVFADDGPVPGSKLLRDQSYGADAKQRYDVYIPAKAIAAPVLVMVHGGGWKNGDKALKSVVENKADHWLAQGYVYVSVNYRLLPEADPLQQADDVAAALADIQQRAQDWGGDSTRVILIGHSAGAHLIDLLAADPSRAFAHGAKPWLGTVSLDSGAVDTVELMQHRHFRLFDTAFGDKPDFWRATSPYEHLTAAAPPFILVCSSQRKDSCPANYAFAARAKGLGVRASVLEQDLTHREINDRLGLPGAYTEAIDAFIRSVLPPAP